MYTLEELRKMKKENSSLWQNGWFVFVRKYIVSHMQNASITYSEALEIEHEFGLEHEDWSMFGGKDEDY